MARTAFPTSTALRLLFLPILVVAALSCGDAAPGRDGGTSLGDRIADLGFEDCEGKSVALSSFAEQHQAIFLTIHAGWCPPCHKQNPFLRELHSELGDRGLIILLVLGEGDFEDTGTVGEEYCADLKNRQRFQFPVLQDEGFASTGHIAGGRYPTQVVLDGDLTIRALDYGWDEAFHRGYITGAVEKILGER
jgi:thiol-disulfide isomerase/thioredoxin